MSFSQLLEPKNSKIVLKLILFITIIMESTLKEMDILQIHLPLQSMNSLLSKIVDLSRSNSQIVVSTFTKILMVKVFTPLTVIAHHMAFSLSLKER